MHAADVVETLPTAGLDDAVLSALRMVLRHGLPALVVADDQGNVVAGLSSVELLRAALPRYMRDEPCLARVYGGDHEDRLVAQLAGTSVRELVSELADRVPVARQEATVMELAEMMARRCCPVVLVERADSDGGVLGVVTANGLLKVLLARAGEASR